MPTENVTNNRAYQLPASGNTLAFDVPRIIAAFEAIDSDVSTQVAALAAKANLANPTFTGVPAAPTPSAGDDSGKIATTAFVKAALAALVDSSPATLNTLNELAAALGDDPDFAATMATLIGTKLAKSSNLSDLANASTALTNLGFSTFVKTLLDDADGSAVLTTLGVSAFIKGLLDDTDAAAALTTLNAPNKDGSNFGSIGQKRLFQGGLGLRPSNAGLLTISAGSLKLSPYKGDLLIDGNGVVVGIPSAGLTLTATGLTPDTLYYVYAYDANSDLLLDTLEAVATGRATSSAGVETKSGSLGRILVGMTYVAAGPSFTQARTRSWNNRGANPLSAVFSTTRSTTSTSFAEINSEIRIGTLLWADEFWSLTATGSMSNSTSGQNTSVAIGVNTVVEGSGGIMLAHAVGSNFPFAVHLLKAAVSESWHEATLFGKVSANTGSYRGGIAGDQCALNGVILPRGY